MYTQTRYERIDNMLTSNVADNNASRYAHNLNKRNAATERAYRASETNATRALYREHGASSARDAYADTMRRARTDAELQAMADRELARIQRNNRRLIVRIRRAIGF